MKLSDRQKLILVGVLADRDHLASLTPRYECGNWPAVTERHRIAEAKEGFIACRPSAWLREEISDSVRVMLGRDYKRLEREGLIERHNLFDGVKTTHLRLTAAGEIAARHLLGEQAAESAPSTEAAGDA